MLIETSKGDIVIDLYTKDCPKTCENFLKLCKIKYYNQCAFHMVEKDFIAQCGDVGRKGGWSVWGLIDGETRRYFADELQAQRRRHNRLAHNKRGVVSMANAGSPNSNSSQFFLQLADSHIDYLDEKHTIFGHVTEGLHVLEELNNIHVSADTHQPLRKFCIHHTIVLEDPFEDPLGIQKLLRERSPTPDVDSDTEYVSSGEDEGVDEVEWNALTSAREAKSREWELVGLGDMADADLEPPKNVLFVCCINPVTEDEDLELAFSRFGKISSCEILRTKDGTSLQYCFIEFVTVKACEQVCIICCVSFLFTPAPDNTIFVLPAIFNFAFSLKRVVASHLTPYPLAPHPTGIPQDGKRSHRRPSYPRRLLPIRSQGVEQMDERR